MNLEFVILGALAHSQGRLSSRELLRVLAASEIDTRAARRALARLMAARWMRVRGEELELTLTGGRRFLELYAAVESALTPAEVCPSVPWLTRVQTRWIDAISLNYAVDPAQLRPLLPPPIEPEIFHGTAWVQILMSSLQDMRPQGMPALFGFCFYQISYRAAVCYTAANGERRRGGYFVHSETNHPLMRAVGNTLQEFRFHDFGAADMVMVRDGHRLSLGVDAEDPLGKLLAVIDTRPLAGPPAGSVWSSLAELQEPLVDCYDAFGVDGDYVYTLTIDREPWNERFVSPISVWSAFAEDGPIAGARLDSVLHIPDCGYRWRPLRRERWR